MDGEQLGMVTETTCRMALSALCPLKSSLGLSADPPPPRYPSGLSNWIWHSQSNYHLKIFYVYVCSPCFKCHLLFSPFYCKDTNNVSWGFCCCWRVGFGFVVGFGVIFKIPYCFLKVHCFQLLIPHWLWNYYHLLMAISTATNVISQCYDFKGKISTINSCKCHLLQTKTGDKETENVTWNGSIKTEYMSKVFFMKYYCILLTINMSVQHRKLPAEHDALNTHKSDCVADVKCKIH